MERFYRKAAWSLIREHRYLHVQRFLAATGAYAAHRCSRQVVAADREAAMPVARELPVRDVDACPAFALDPDLGPGVARGLVAVARIDVAAHVARRNPRRAAAGDEKVRVVLAHSPPHFQRMRRGAGH